MSTSITYLNVPARLLPSESLVGGSAPTIATRTIPVVQIGKTEMGAMMNRRHLEIDGRTFQATVSTDGLSLSLRGHADGWDQRCLDQLVAEGWTLDPEALKKCDMPRAAAE